MAGGWRGGHLEGRTASSLPIVLAILVLAGCSVVERPASRRLRDEIARIRAAGEPLTFEELRAGQAAGDGADAAADYRAAVTLLTDLDSGPLFEVLSAYRAGTQPLWTSPMLRSGVHTLRLRVTGEMNDSSGGTFVVPDKLDILP